MHHGERLLQEGLCEWLETPDQLRLGTGSGTGHRMGARDVAQRKNYSCRSRDQQLREFICGRGRGNESGLGKRWPGRSLDELGRQRIFE